MLITYGMASRRWDGPMLDKRVEFCFEWLSTFLLLTGAALTSYNVYPTNVYLSMVGNLGWLVVALSWRKWSLITIQLIITVIYLAGLINNGVLK